jgi:hypothetical protein
VARRRDWKHIHHSPLFWVAFVLFLVAIAVYVLTEDLSWRPRIHHQPASRTALGAVVTRIG